MLSNHVRRVNLIESPYYINIIVVCLGDLFDASAASVHPDEVKHTLLDEYAVASNFLEQVRRAAPTNASFVWTLGNHDDNIQRCDPR